MTTTWHHPTFGQITYADLRTTGQPDPEPEIGHTTMRVNITDTPEAKHLIGEMDATPGHEARHAVVGMFLDFKVLQARADMPEDHVLGQVAYDFTGEEWTPLRLAEHMVQLIAGSTGEKTGPPAWPLRADDGMASDNSDEKQLARLAGQLHLNQHGYEKLVDIAQTIVSHPSIKQAIGDVSTMLDVGMALDERMLKDLYASAITTVQREARPPTTDELQHQAAVREGAHYKSMMTLLKASSEHHAAEELRKRAEAVTREFEATLSHR